MIGNFNVRITTQLVIFFTLSWVFLPKTLAFVVIDLSCLLLSAMVFLATMIDTTVARKKVAFSLPNDDSVRPNQHVRMRIRGRLEALSRA